MLVILRFAIAAMLALLVTVGLIYTMQALISSSQQSLDDSETGYIVDFIRLKKAEPVIRKLTKPDKPVQPKAPPSAPPPPAKIFNKPAAEKMQLISIPISADISLTASGISLSPGDAEYLPIVKIAPIYPRRALQRGIEGYVIVEFTVTKQGSTKDIKVIESEPATSIFHRASIKAASKFKYKPATIDGKPVEVKAVRNKIIFRMGK